MRLRRREDDGQVATAVMIVVAVSLVAVTALGVLRLGAAVDERGQAQTAADAAALGGAEAVRDDLPELFARATSPAALAAIGDALTCGIGREGAVELAAANGAGVTSYCYDSLADRVEVTVENRTTGDAATGTATASAVAALGLLVDDCETDPDLGDGTPTPPAPPPGGSRPPEPPGPPAGEPPDGDAGTPAEVTLTCGDIEIEFERDGAGLRLVTPPDELAESLEDALEPRLVE